MKNTTVAGIDVSKHFSDLCVLSADNSVLRELHFTHDQSGLKQAAHIMKEIEVQQKEKPVLIMESTSHYHRLPYYFFREQGFDVVIVNPLQSNAIKNISIRKVKTDKVDAYRIALLYRLQSYEATNQPIDILFDLRNLTRQYSDLVKSRTMYTNQLIAYLDQAFPSFRKVFKDVTALTALALLDRWPTPQAILVADKSEVFEVIRKVSRSGAAYATKKAEGLFQAATQDVEINIQAESNKVLIKSIVSIIRAFIDNMKIVQDEVKKLMKSDSHASTQVNLLSSIPGISWFGASILLSEISDITRFKKPAQLVAYCGLDPSQRQSGMFKGNKNKISKRGCRYIRRLLNMSAVTAVSKNSTGAYNNPVLAEFYQGKCLSKPKKVALCAVMNKMVHIIFAVLRDQKPFELREPEEHAIWLRDKSRLAS